MKREITKSFWVDPEKRTGEMRLELSYRNLSKPQPGAAALPKTGEASQFKNNYWDGGAAATEEVSTLPVSEILPREEDLYYLSMRAISQAVVEGYWVDYTRPGVLEGSAAMLSNQRICVDHCWWKAESAIGAIVESAWDAAGKESNGVPGINIRFFVDSKLAPGIVRRLAYPVPAIHSGSVTIGFEWEPSHPDLLEEDKFFWFLGENVDGQIVRLIATKILYFIEFSLVYEGADPNAKRLADPEAEDDLSDEMKRKKEGKYSAPKLTEPPEGGITKEVTTVKLTAELKKILGLESYTAEDVPETVLLTAVEGFAPRLAVAEQIIAAERTEVVRLATLAEVGAEGQLPEALAAIIQQAPADQLTKLKDMYAKKAEARFGADGNGIARSSQQAPIAQSATVAQSATPRMAYL